MGDDGTRLKGLPPTEDVQKGHDSSMGFQYLNFVSDRYPYKLASIFLFGHPL